MNPELGNTLEDMLRILADPAPLEKTITVAEVVEQFGLPFDIVEERFKTLINCGFITTASIHHVSLSPFDISAPYRITAEGVNYLELRDRHEEERAADRRFEQKKLLISTIAALIGGAIAASFPMIITCLTAN